MITTATFADMHAGPVQHVDGYAPDIQDYTDVRAGFCIHCSAAYSEDIPVIYVRTISGVIWWHRLGRVQDRHCHAI